MARIDLLGLALHAFPRRFRAARAEELRATAADAADAGLALDSRALVDVVLAGWRERARTHPPLGSYLGYRFLERRLPSRWHRWVIDDVSGWIGFRAMLWMVPLLAPLWLATGASTATFVFLALTPVGAASNRRTRRRILERHGIDPTTRTYAPPPRPFPAWVPPPPVRRRAAPVLLATGCMLMLVAPVAALPLVAPRFTATHFGSTVIREVDHRGVVGLSSVALAVVLGIVGWLIAYRIGTETFAQPVPGGETVASSTPVFVGIAVVGGVGVSAALWPIAPLIVPAAYVVVGGVGPALVVAGLRVLHSERETGRVVVLRRPSRSPARAD